MAEALTNSKRPAVVYIDAGAIESALTYAQNELQRVERTISTTAQRIADALGRRVSAVELVHTANLVRELATAIAPTLPPGGRQQAAQEQAKQVIHPIPRMVLGEPLEHYLSADGERFVWSVPPAYAEQVRKRYTIMEGSRRAQIARAAELIAEGANLLSDAGVLIAPASVCSLAPVRWDGATYRADFARVCDLFQRPEFL